MALVATKKSHDIVGAKIMQIYDLAFTSVTGGVINTGLRNIEFASYQPSTSEDAGIVYKNSASASETQDDFGSVYVDGVTSDDNGMLLVIGH